MKNNLFYIIIALFSFGCWALAVSEAVKLGTDGTLILPAFMGTAGMMLLFTWLIGSYRRIIIDANTTNRGLLAQNKRLAADLSMHAEMNRTLSEQNHNLTNEMLAKVAAMQQTVDMYEKSLHDQIEKLDAVVPKEK